MTTPTLLSQNTFASTQYETEDKLKLKVRINAQVKLAKLQSVHVFTTGFVQYNNQENARKYYCLVIA